MRLPSFSSCVKTKEYDVTDVNLFLVTLDVSSLYTNIPHKKGIDANRHFLDTCFNKHIPTETLGSLSKDIFERRTSTGSEPFSFTICLDANKFVLVSFFALIKTTYLRVSTKPLPNDAKSSLPVDVRRSKTLLLKLPIM